MERNIVNPPSFFQAPTFATFSPTLKVSPRIKERLQRMLEEYRKGDGNGVK